MATGPPAVGSDLIGETTTYLVNGNETLVVNQLDLLLETTCGFVIELLPTFGHCRDHVLADGGVMRIAKDLAREHDLDHRIGVGDSGSVDKDIARLQRQCVVNGTILAEGLDDQLCFCVQ